MKRNLLPILILLFSMSSVMAQVNITFQLNTATITPDASGIFIGGGTGFDGPTDNQMTDNGNGTYSITFTKDVGFSSHYAFLNGDCGWNCKENIAGLPCADPTNFNDRWLPPVMSDTTILACYGTCDNDGSCTIVTDSVDITFLLNTANITPDASGIFIGGGSGFDGPTDNQMTDNGDGTFSITFTKALGFSSHYTFLNGDCGWNCKENIAGLPCSDPNNFNDRWLPAVMSDTTILACYENCADDGTCDVILNPNLPMDFEDAAITYAPAGFGNATSEIVANPFIDADNGSAMVWNITKPVGSETWAGASINLENPMDFALTNTINLKFYSAFAGIPVLVKIENADGSSTAEVQVNSTVDNGWETMSFDMSTSMTGVFDPMVEYTKFVAFPDFNNVPFISDIPFYFDDVELDVIPTLPVLTVDFEDDGLIWNFGNFGGVDTAERIANPDMNGNTSATVLHTNKIEGAEVWGGVFLDLETPIDFSGSTNLTLDVWAPNVSDTILLKLEEIDGGTSTCEVKAVTTVANGWHTLTFDMATSTVGTFDPAALYRRVVVFPDFGKNGPVGSVDHYFDNIANGDPAKPTIPVDFEANGLAWDLFGFGGVDLFERIANPDMTGNASATVYHLNKKEGAEVWAGSGFPLESAIDFSSNTVLSVDVWSPNAGDTILLKLEALDAMGTVVTSVEVKAAGVVGSGWETLTFDMSTSTTGIFDPAANYNQVILFPNFGTPGEVGGADYYFDNIQFYTTPIILPSLPIDFESASITYQNTGFGNAVSSVIGNPGPDAMNGSATVLSIEKPVGAEVWAGASMPLANQIDMTTATGTVFSVNVWAPKTGASILLKIEGLADPGAIFAEISATTTVANAWHTLYFDISQFAGFDINAVYDQVVLFPDFGVAGAGDTYYFDDIMGDDIMDGISNEDLSKVNVKAFPNPTDNELNLQFSIPVSGQITVSVVDILGRNVQYVDFGKLTEGNHQEAIDFSKLTTGNYFMVMRLDGDIIATQNVTKK